MLRIEGFDCKTTVRKCDFPQTGNTVVLTGKHKSSKEESNERWIWRERSSGSFTRTYQAFAKDALCLCAQLIPISFIQIPRDADVERVMAKFENGMLSLDFPAKAGGGAARTKSIDIA